MVGGTYQLDLLLCQWGVSDNAHGAGALDGAGYFALVLGAGSCYAGSKDFVVLRQKTTQKVCVLPLNLLIRRDTNVTLLHTNFLNEASKLVCGAELLENLVP